MLTALSLSACASGKIDNPDKQARLANIHYRLGIDALGKQGMLPKAFHELIKSDEIRPDQPEVLDALAYAWLLRGDMKKSETYYLRAIHQHAGAATYNNYANLLNHMKRYEEAEKAARKALDDPRYPNQDLAFINLGDALSGQKKYKSAIAVYQEANVFNPNSDFIKLKMAHAYDKQGKLREARLLYEAALMKQQDNRAAAEGLLAVLKQQQDTGAAIAILNQFNRHAAAPLDKAWAQNELEQLKNQ
ncbi:MAG: tetratricopeptide repeat protein [Mariprofundus sp.]|nr:tetratricopeptide repeat protein [Mariprofundus sp.]